MQIVTEQETMADHSDDRW